MPEHPPLRIVRPSAGPAPSPPATRLPAGQANVREVFKSVVVASLDAGFLRYSRRAELIELAGRLGIGEFEACLLIAEAQFRSGEIDPVEFAESGLSPTPVAEGISTSTKIALALAAAAFVDVLVVCWLL